MLLHEFFFIIYNPSSQEPWQHSVVLFEIVMVSPGTHLINLNIDSKTLYYSLLKEKYTPSIVNHSKD